MIRFVKDNFLSDRVFCDLTDLNWQALEWCNKQNGTYRRTVDGESQKIHETVCGEQLRMVPECSVRFYLCLERKISFDGFVNYEGRRFGVPYSYPGATARVERSGDLLHIYYANLKVLLGLHIPLPGAARTVSVRDSTNPWHSQKNFPQRLYKHRFCNFPNPHRIFPLPNSILTRRTRYEENNL